MAVKKTPDTKPEEVTIQEEKVVTPAKTKAPAARTPQAAFFMYIGPSIRGVISKNAIYRRDELKKLDEALAAHTDIRYLLIPGDQLGAARADLKKPDSFLAAVYDRLANKA